MGHESAYNHYEVIIALDIYHQLLINIIFPYKNSSAY